MDMQNYIYVNLPLFALLNLNQFSYLPVDYFQKPQQGEVF